MLTGIGGMLVKTTPTTTNSSPFARRTFRYKVTLQNRNSSASLSDLGWDKYLTAIRVTETINAPDELTLRFRNVGRFILSDAPLLSEGTRIKVELGWSEVGLVRHGTFRIHRPIQTFGGDNGILIRALGEESLLAKAGDIQQIWSKGNEGIKDSEIVRQIAEEYGFDTDDIQETPDRFLTVAQCDTDWDFLLKRARLYGYQVYVRDGSLHFHAPRLMRSRGALAFKSHDPSRPDNISKMLTTVNAFRAAPEIEKSQVSADNFEVMRAKSDSELDFLARRQTGVQFAPAIVGKVGQSRTILVGDGHLNTPAEIDRQVRAVFKSGAFATVEAECESIGLEFLRANETVEVHTSWLKRFSGDWLIEKVEHVFDTRFHGTYVSKFTLIRSFLKFTDYNPNLSGGGGPSSVSGPETAADRKNPPGPGGGMQLPLTVTATVR